MGLLDHLFKSKPDDGVEKAVGNGQGQADGSAPATGGKPAGEPRTVPDPTAFLQPKTYVPRAGAPVIPAHVEPIAKPAEKPPEKAAADGQPRVIVVTLGDLFSRIPPQYLKAGVHDHKRELRFTEAELSSDIARHRAAVPLSKIAALCPDIFHSPITAMEECEVRLPLQKVLDQIAFGGQRRAQSSAHAATLTPPSIPLSQPLPFAAASQAAKISSVEKPATAESPVEPKPATAVPPADAATKLPDNGHVLRESEPAAGFEDGGQEKIFLSLAAILARCPDSIFVGERPRVNEAVRMAFPFAPIERQLVNGSVEVSSHRFVSLLPPGYSRYFQPRDGVKIPLPLEEIFQNLPGNGPVVEPPVSPIVYAEPPQTKDASSAKADPPFAPKVTPPPMQLFRGSGIAAPTPARVSVVASKSVHADPIVVPPTPAAAAPPADEIVQAESAASESHGIVPIVSSAVATGDRAIVGEKGPAQAGAEASSVVIVLPDSPDNKPAAGPVTLAKREIPPVPAGDFSETLTTHAEPPVVLQGRAASHPEVGQVAAVDASHAAEIASALVRVTGATENGSGPLATNIFPAPNPPMESEPAGMSAIDNPPDRVLPPQADPPSAREPATTTPMHDEPSARPDESAVAPAATANENRPGFDAPPVQLPVAVVPEPALAKDSAASASVGAPAAETQAAEHNRTGVTPSLRPLDVQVRSDSPLSVDLKAAVLQSTKPEPEPSAILARPTLNIQPPRQLRPVVVMPPPIAAVPSVASAAPIASAPEVKLEIADAPVAAAAAPAPAVTNEAQEQHSEPASPLRPDSEEVVKISPAGSSKKRGERRRAEALAAKSVEPAVVEPVAALKPPSILRLPSEASAAATPDSAPLNLSIPEVRPQSAPEHAGYSAQPDPAVPPLGIVPFDQERLQALFMTDEPLDLARVASLAAALPGMQACIVQSRGEMAHHGELPRGFDVAPLHGVARLVAESSVGLPLGPVANVTIFGEHHAASVFARGETRLCAVHGVRGFAPGVREKLAAIADELSR